MPRLTPEKAFDFVFKSDAANIDWGDATSYKPTRWRPATIDDVKRALDEPFECRASGEGGFVPAGGYIKADGKLVFEVRKEGCITRERSGNVEVLDA